MKPHIIRHAVEPLECRRLLSAPLTLPDHAVRIAYLIPSNRAAQPDALATIRSAFSSYQNWFADQMDRNGFGRKTFALETLADGVTTDVKVVALAQKDDYYRADPWGRVQADALGAGITLGAPGESWVLFYEGHVQTPDGRVEGGSAGGTGPGTGDGGGVAVLGSDMIALMKQSYLTDQREYAGVTIPELGSYPIAAGAFIPDEGTTISSVVSSRIGAVAHELAHTFGLAHGYRNDENFRGNLLGHGLRGFRGNLLPDQFPNDWTRLEYADALALSHNRFFNAGGTFAENDPPQVTSFTGGAVMFGSLNVTFSATDASGLSAALLGDESGIIDQLELSGTSASGSFMIPNYTPNAGNHYFLFVYDTQGNRVDRDTVIGAGEDETINRAPIPFLKISLETPMVGETVTFDASRTIDPDPGHVLSTLKFDWDLDGDGTFEASSASSTLITATFTTPGTRLVQLRVTDPLAGAAVSAPIGIRVVANAQPDGWISGRCFNDLDGDGVKEAGESALKGWRVYIDADKDGVWDAGEVSTVSDSVGNYSFIQLPPGTYRVREVLPKGWRLSRPAAGFRDHVIAAGSRFTGQDFATTQKTLITGTLFNDANANGIRDRGEGALAGWTVYVDANKNYAYDAATERAVTTDSIGVFTFKDLPAGSYRIRNVLKTGWRRVNPSWGYYDLNPSSGATVTGKNFALTQKALISGTVFNDANRDRMKQAGESTLSAWRVYIDANHDGKWQTTEKSVVSDSAGRWSFNDLAGNATYRVRVLQKAGWKLTTPSAGYYSLLLAPGSSSSGRIFGESVIPA